jgi:hypothetical protein
VINTKSSAQTITLSNNDAVAHAISTIAIAGPDASDYGLEANGCENAVAPTSKCTISIAFTPKDVKTLTASVGITDTTPGSTPSVNLTGTGAQPPADPLSIYTPLLSQQKVISGVADKGSQYVSINVYKGTGCNVATLPSGCTLDAVGQTEVSKESGGFAARLFGVDSTTHLSNGEPTSLENGDIVVATESFTDTGVALPRNPTPIFVKRNSYAESNVPWGNVTPTFSTGFVLSQNNGQFSQFNLFLGLNVDTSYHIRKKYRANVYVGATHVYTRSFLPNIKFGLVWKFFQRWEWDWRELPHVYEPDKLFSQLYRLTEGCSHPRRYLLSHSDFFLAMVVRWTREQRFFLHQWLKEGSRR